MLKSASYSIIVIVVVLDLIALTALGMNLFLLMFYQWGIFVLGLVLVGTLVFSKANLLDKKRWRSYYNGALGSFFYILAIGFGIGLGLRLKGSPPTPEMSLLTYFIMMLLSFTSAPVGIVLGIYNTLRCEARNMEDVKRELEGTERKKVSYLRYIIVAVVLIIVVGIVFAAYEWKKVVNESYRPVVIGGAAPDFEFQDLSKKRVKLSDYKGKVVFLNFWATWCKPCKEEMPSMELLYKAMKGKDFEMIAVSIDKDIAKVEPFVKELKLTFPIVLDFIGKADRRYKLTDVPETYIIDQNGVIVEKILGPRDWTRQESLQRISVLLKKGG